MCELYSFSSLCLFTFGSAPAQILWLLGVRLYYITGKQIFFKNENRIKKKKQNKHSFRKKVKIFNYGGDEGLNSFFYFKVRPSAKKSPACWTNGVEDVMETCC